MIKPFLHWCGGKRQLLPEIKKYMPKQYNVYYEPFLGAGALLFDLQPKVAVINDLNSELINCYNQIQFAPNMVIQYLLQFPDTEESYYEIRNWDRLSHWNSIIPIIKAARTIYLNKTNFNGLYRVNKDGFFNVPYGKHKTKFIPDGQNIRLISEYLRTNISIRNMDFKDAVFDAKEGDFIYFDPPYDPVSETSNFTSYTKEGFTKQDQIRLRNCFKELSNRGCYCMLSNAGTDFIKDLYKEFNIVEVKANRVLNCKGDKRGKVSEVLIMNYNNQTGE